MPNRRDVRPDICEVQPIRMELAAMASIVLDISAAVATDGDRDAGTVERLWSPVAVVNQAVVAWVQPARDWQRHLHVDRDPMPKEQAMPIELMSQLDVPPREVVDKK